MIIEVIFKHQHLHIFTYIIELKLKWTHLNQVLQFDLVQHFISSQ